MGATHGQLAKAVRRGGQPWLALPPAGATVAYAGATVAYAGAAAAAVAQRGKEGLWHPLEKRMTLPL
ncbi:hypothetical protein GW17_00027928 [Ensete ventricosum]|nr:hypothetical protein GW17_00027928 [Ensete ventricosum]